MKTQECPRCGQRDTEETKTDFVFTCRACGHYFEVDEFELDLIQNKRVRQYKKNTV